MWGFKGLGVRVEFCSFLGLALAIFPMYRLSKEHLKHPPDLAP